MTRTGHRLKRRATGGGILGLRMLSPRVERLLQPTGADPPEPEAFAMLALLRASRAEARDDWRERVRSWWRKQPPFQEHQLLLSCGVARLELELNVDAEWAEACFTGRQACEFLSKRAPRAENGLVLTEAGRTAVASALGWFAPVLALGGRVFGDWRFYTDAADQLFTYASHAHDAVTSLFFRAWDRAGQEGNEVLEAVGNGMLMNALVDTIELLPLEHPRRRALVGVLTYTAFGLSAVQDPTGAWREILDDETAAFECRGTALITAAFARGVCLELLNPEHYDTALRGWDWIQANMESTDAAGALLAAAAIEQLKAEA